MRFAATIAARIAAAKRRLKAGGLLQEVEWGVPTGEPDERGRRTFTFSTINALIAQRHGIDRATTDTDRADDTVLTVFDPLSISTEHLFRWGNPPHTYKIKEVRGLLENAETGVRFASEIALIR